MSILKRYKVNAEEGFKKLVTSVEQSSPDKQKNILQSIFLEDPIYAQYIAPNVLTFDYILKFDDTEMRELWNSTKGAARIFCFAFFGTPEEKVLLEDQLQKDTLHMYEDEKAKMTSIAKAQRASARNALIENVRKLQDALILPNFPWHLPPRNVVKGEHYVIPKEGEFSLTYDNGQVALKGYYQDKLRMGQWEIYFSNGNLMAKGIYNLGEKDDLWEYYFSSGMLKAKGRYFQDLKEGEWIETDKYGLEVKVNYKKGQKARA